MITRWMMFVLVVGAAVAAPARIHAQRGRGGAVANPTARASAPVDLTGYWVSVVTEDWRWRMVTPIKGDFAGVPHGQRKASR